MIVTTLNKIKKHNPCEDGWKTLLRYLEKTKSDDEPLAFLTILESNGFDDSLWCIKSAPEYQKEWRLFSVWCARRVQHLMTDERSIAALDVAEKFANGYATREELSAAWDAAGAAANAAANAAVWAAANAAAWAAANAAVWAASSAAANAATSVATRDATWAATSASAATRAAQKQQFIKIISGE